MKKLVITTGAGVVLCLLACLARADALPGVYTYKLVLRDDQGFALRGTETPLPDERVSSNYKIEVLNSKGDPVRSQVDDVTSLGSDRTTGCNCTLSVSVGEGTGYATVGEQLTLVVTTKYDGTERFRSSKVLPPGSRRPRRGSGPVQPIRRERPRLHECLSVESCFAVFSCQSREGNYVDGIHGSSE